MKCPTCNEEVNELDQKCPKCGLIFEEYEEEIKSEEEKQTNDARSKTLFLNLINILQLIGFVIMMFVQINDEEIMQGVIYLVIGIVLFAFIKGFINIIDLLDEINQKIK